MILHHPNLINFLYSFSISFLLYFFYGLSVVLVFYTRSFISINWDQSQICRKILYSIIMMAENCATRFEIPCFDETNFAMWKLKMHAMLVKDGCAIAFLNKEDKLEGMTNKQFAKKDEMALANLFLRLEDSILFNIETETNAKRLLKKLKSIYERKSLVNKIFLKQPLQSKDEGWSINSKAPQPLQFFNQ